MNRLRLRLIQTGGSRGSVSIYFIAITAAFVFLTSFLIDFSRIATFRKQAELAVQAGVRSVLSSYDPVVFERYGLFIRGGEDGGSLLRATLEGNGSGNGAEEGSTFHYLDMSWTEAEVMEGRPLADHEVFRRQVLEEMKYKAPIDLTLELGNRFKGMDSAIQEAARTVDLLERMRKLYERREAALDRALALQVQAGKQAVDDLRAVTPYPSAGENVGKSAGAFSNLAAAAMLYDDYYAKRQADEASEQAYLEAVAAGAKVLPIPIRPNAASVAAYESSASELATRLVGAANRLRQEAEATVMDAEETLQQAKAANEEMRLMTQQALSSSDRTGRTGAKKAAEVGDGPELETESGNAADSLEEIRKTAENMVLESGFFDTYAVEIRDQQEEIARLAQAVVSGSSKLASLSGADTMAGGLRAAAEQLTNNLNEYAGSYGVEGAVIRSRRALFEQHRSQDAERKALENEAKTEWKGWTGLIGGFRHLNGTPEEQESFRQADEWAQDNLAWNKEQAELPPPDLDEQSPDAGRDAALTNTTGVLAALDESITGARDALFLSEYIHARFSRFPPAQVKQLLEGKSVPKSLDRQQTEYVLYGFANPSGNLAAAYGQIFGFRLAIRTLEGLIVSRNAGHPLLVLAAALVYGVRYAVQDMHTLLERDAVSLSKYVKFNTTYADYLRVFMLLHGNSASILSRCIAVFESDTGLDATQAYTYERAEGTASLKLWFFPGLLKLLNRTGHLGGTLKGNQYETTYTAEMGYQ